MELIFALFVFLSLQFCKMWITRMNSDCILDVWKIKLLLQSFLKSLINFFTIIKLTSKPDNCYVYFVVKHIWMCIY